MADPQGNPAVGINSYLRFLADIRSVASWFSKGLLLAPIVAGVLWKIGPPKPHALAVSGLTVISEIACTIWIFTKYSSSNSASLKAALRWFLIFLVFGWLSYLAIYFAFVREMDDSDHRDLRGLAYSGPAKVAIDSGIPESELLAEAQYDPEAVFLPWTVNLNRFLCVICWLIAYNATSCYIGVFVLRGQPLKE